MTTWRVLLSSTWDQDTYKKNWELFLEKNWKLFLKHRSLPQSKGACRMKKIPKKGDKVLFVFRGFVVMKGIVESDGFITGTQHREHSCNIGKNRPHASANDYHASVKIEEVGLSEEIRWMGQRTWVVIEN